jgi:hypothetical protein
MGTVRCRGFEVERAAGVWSSVGIWNQIGFAKFPLFAFKLFYFLNNNVKFFRCQHRRTSQADLSLGYSSIKLYDYVGNCIFYFMELNSLVFLFSQSLENQTSEKHTNFLQGDWILMDNFFEGQLGLVENLLFCEESVFFLIGDSYK